MSSGRPSRRQINSRSSGVYPRRRSSRSLCISSFQDGTRGGTGTGAIADAGALWTIACCQKYSLAGQCGDGLK